MGRTITAISLAQAIRHPGKQAVFIIRRPSLGPTSGVKGGAAGDGYSQVMPMEGLTSI